MSDLVKKLQLYAWAGYAEKITIKQAADRIEQLEAELAEAVGLMQDMRDHGANDYVIDRVLGFLARHQKETDT